MIFAVMLVRNEVDIIRVNILHHLAFGVDHILVADNGSTDGTSVILEELAETKRVHVISRPGAFYQAETATELAREAFLRGARWVLPIDADELWHVPVGRLRDILDDSGDAGALEVEVVNFVQRREQEVLEPRALLTMIRRVPLPVGTSGEADVLVESGRISFVECCYPPKHIVRGSIGLQVAQGNHTVGGVGGPIRKTAAICCLHAPLRARAGLAQKVDLARPVDEIRKYLEPCWHLRRWRRLAATEQLGAEWAANSYLADCLDVSGEKHPLAIDTTLRDLVMPWIDRPADAVREALRAVRQNRRQKPPVAPLDPATTGEILSRMRNVEGWLRDEEAELLIHMTRRAVTAVDASAVVEIGSFCGKSTIVLAGAARTVAVGARIYAIDPHQGEVGAEDTIAGVQSVRPTFERFLHNIAGAEVADVIEPIRRRSYEVSWRLPIALLFIDGLHDYSSVARDFFHFEPYLENGGYVAFHDCDDNYLGVRAFVAGLAADGSFKEVARAASLVVLQKAVDLPEEPPGDLAGGVMALSRRVAQQQNGIEFLMREIASRELTIRARDEGIEWLRSVIQDKATTIAELEKGVAWLRKEIAERDVRLEALQRASAGTVQADTAEQHLTALLPGRSITS